MHHDGDDRREERREQHLPHRQVRPRFGLPMRRYDRLRGRQSDACRRCYRRSTAVITPLCGSRLRDGRQAALIVKRTCEEREDDAAHPRDIDGGLEREQDLCWR